ncbi:MAG TPA: ATP-dependent DNA ligase [Candidatus Limnocylindria bacterium]|nr:ATP-dependent DNA ligase [Candidatus Limnocylindria bacterium]
MSPTSTSFADWVATADAVRATTRKLQKLDALAAYFRSLPDADLPLAVRLFAGTPFPRTDERVLAVGWSALSAAILERAGRSGDDLGRAYQRHADLGDAAAELITDPPQGEPLTIADIAAAFDAIAEARGVAPKRELLLGVLRRADAAAARYIVKIISGEPRIGLREGLLEDAVARAFGREREAVGRAHMLEGDIGAAAIRARAGTLADAAFAHFAPIGMMLATPVLDLAEVGKRFPPPYVVEDKYDGVRAQVHKHGDRVELYSRTFDRVTDRFPELLGPLRAIPGSYVLDAEVMAFEEGRAIPFTRFQRRLGRKQVSDDLLAELPATLVIFDVLERDGAPLLDLPLAERQPFLDALRLDPPLARARREALTETADALVARLDAAFDAARARGNEGLMVKDPRSPYRPGRRGMEWLKVKRALRTLDVVVTAVEWGHGKRRDVLSDYTFAVRDGARLRNIGKAYSGLTDREIAELTEFFKSHTVRDLGRARLVEPNTVIEVAFDQIQASGRHDSGFALRFPRIVRLRPDKPVSEIDTLDTVREIAAGGA